VFALIFGVLTHLRKDEATWRQNPVMIMAPVAFLRPLRLQDSMQTGSRFLKTIKIRRCSSQAKKRTILAHGTTFRGCVPGEDGATAS
jgi:hypothetical protein